jgi:hypothetical protein
MSFHFRIFIYYIKWIYYLTHINYITRHRSIRLYPNNVCSNFLYEGFLQSSIASTLSFWIHIQICFHIDAILVSVMFYKVCNFNIHCRLYISVFYILAFPNHRSNVLSTSNFFILTRILNGLFLGLVWAYFLVF